MNRCAEIVQPALDRFGRLDAVVSNAGIPRDAIFHRVAPEDWLAVISVHLNGNFLISRAAADLFRKQESGAFVHVASTSGLIGNMGQANYASAGPRGAPRRGWSPEAIRRAHPAGAAILFMPLDTSGQLFAWVPL